MAREQLWNHLRANSTGLCDGLPSRHVCSLLPGPGHDLEVPLQGGLKESAAAHLLNRDEATAEFNDAQLWGGVR
jgi:hypothetical protein